MAQLGSPGEFDPTWRPNIDPAPANPDAEGRDIAAEIAAQEAAAQAEAEVTSDDIDSWPVTDDEEHQDDDRLSALQALILGANGQGGPVASEYLLFPEHLALFVHHEIMSSDEARDYLRSRGINLR